MTHIQVSISINSIIDRLRVLHDELVADNDHTNALIIELAIQAIEQLRGKP